MEEIIKNIDKKYHSYYNKFKNNTSLFFNDYKKIKKHLLNYQNKKDNQYSLINHSYFIRYKIKYTMFNEISKGHLFYDKTYKSIINEEMKFIKHYFNKISIKNKKNIISSLKKFNPRDNIHLSIISFILSSF